MTAGEADGGNEAFPASIFARRIAISGAESAERDDPGNYPAVNDLERHYPGHGDVRVKTNWMAEAPRRWGQRQRRSSRSPCRGGDGGAGGVEGSGRKAQGCGLRELSARWPAAADACAAAGQKAGETPGDRKEDSSVESRHLHLPAFPTSHVAALGAGGAATPA
ncbi:uncharacterized protein EI90DRAFT_3295662 [Cantharellus anzutake]|uniref:uncharacterized protein n=1 Tax=Cantharellus anzutake TaxID=1750568 RepID=UPI00190724F6|nr:uncharacterized protein EI90DRAFT_3295662 [Cantharellus anzutake]KAF8310811.1 hypothetical protein EI90DRAFT_3295662 [Cantharellus anzutake]